MLRGRRLHTSHLTHGRGPIGGFRDRLLAVLVWRDGDFKGAMMACATKGQHFLSV
jgi:hypothetical protein